MKLQKLLSYVRRAVDDYHMIAEGDKIAVGISGGKDSLALLYALAHLRRFYPSSFELAAVSVDLGFPGFDPTEIEQLCASLGVSYYVHKTEIYDIVFHARREENPCSLCTKMRKGAFNTFVQGMGCNKVAYGHHMDDAIETLLMSLIFEGRVHCFSPVTLLDRMQITAIRPLIYVPEADIIGFKNKYQLPVMPKLCPNDGISRREYVKDLIREIDKNAPGVRSRMFTAILNGKIKGWEKD